MKEQWKKQMQQKMADYRESDVDVSWAELEKALAVNRQKARIIPLWGRRVAAAAVIVLLAGVGYWIHSRLDTTSEVQKELAGTAKPESKPESVASVQENHEPAPVAKVVIRRLVNVASQSISPEEQDASTEETDTPVETSESNGTPESEDTVFLPSYTPPRQMTTYTSHLEKKSPSNSRLTAKLYFSNTMATGSQVFSSVTRVEIPQDNPQDSNPSTPTPEKDGNAGGGGDSSSGENITGALPDDDGSDGDDNDENGANTRAGELPAYRDLETHESIRHHQPIRLGFSLRYGLNERWSIETGVTYTRHSSDITHTQYDQTIAYEQRLTYIGIPVSASYLVWSSRYFDFYLSAGGLVEKMVKGSRTTKSGIISDVTISPLQFSLNAAAGAEFRFTHAFSLYAEPMLSYYFDNGSQISTIYQEKPFNYGFNIGLRFNINR